MSPPDDPSSIKLHAPTAHGRPRGRKLSDILTDIANDPDRERVSVADLLGAMHDRALAALLFIFAVPNVLPMPPGTSTFLGVPLVLLTAQLALGLRPWLPKLIVGRSMARSDFAALVARAAPWLARAERLLRPRLSIFARPPAEYVVGVVCFILSLILLLPIPFGNMPPAFAICLVSLGVLERDGLWTLAGLLAAAVSIAIAWGVVYALVKSAIFLLTNALDL